MLYLSGSQRTIIGADTLQSLFNAHLICGKAGDPLYYRAHVIIAVGLEVAAVRCIHGVLQNRSEPGFALPKFFISKLSLCNILDNATYYRWLALGLSEYLALYLYEPNNAVAFDNAVFIDL
jgi:hypothetical protein